jgi:hypothetical protein
MNEYLLNLYNEAEALNLSKGELGEVKVLAEAVLLIGTMEELLAWNHNLHRALGLLISHATPLGRDIYASVSKHLGL